MPNNPAAGPLVYRVHYRRAQISGGSSSSDMLVYVAHTLKEARQYCQEHKAVLCHMGPTLGWYVVFGYSKDKLGLIETAEMWGPDGRIIKGRIYDALLAARATDPLWIAQSEHQQYLRTHGGVLCLCYTLTHTAPGDWPNHLARAAEYLLENNSPQLPGDLELLARAVRESARDMGPQLYSKTKASVLASPAYAPLRPLLFPLVSPSPPKRSVG